ncbi:hypothetical protein Ae201684P_012728 [Aphanomyces euteiches]|nr:hypothetical protein Ae201684P_012728 [Aphanomyces euteiches]
MGCGQSARVSPSTVVVQSTNQDADLQKSKWIQMTSRTVKLVVNGSAMLLVAVDIVGNNWEFNHFVGEPSTFSHHCSRPPPATNSSNTTAFPTTHRQRPSQTSVAT